MSIVSGNHGIKYTLTASLFKKKRSKIIFYLHE